MPARNSPTVQRVVHSRARAAVAPKMGRLRLCCEISYDGTGLLGWQAQRSQARASLKDLAAAGCGVGVPKLSPSDRSAAVGKQSHVRETKTEHEAHDDHLPTSSSRIASETAGSSKADNSDDDDILTFSLFDESDLGNDDGDEDRGGAKGCAEPSSLPPRLASSVGCTTSDSGSSKSDVNTTGVSTAHESQRLLPLEDDVLIANTNMSAPELSVQHAASELESTSATAAIPVVTTPSSVSEILDAVVRPLLAEALPHLQQAPSFAIAVSRTDAGVHARAALVSFNLKMKGFDGAVTTLTFPDINLDEITRQANRRLPAAVRVRSLRWAPGVWYPARVLRGKEYVYTVCSSLAAASDECSAGDTADARFAWDLGLTGCTLDVTRMREAAAMMVGTHDFAMLSTFKKRTPLQSRGTDIERTTVRTVTSLTVETDGYACFDDISGPTGARGCLINVDPSEPPGVAHLACPGCGGPSVAAVSLVTVRVQGDGFLTHQVRRMVAALVEVGLSCWSVGDVAKLLRGEGIKPERAPPHGLCMWRLNLDENASGLPRPPRRHARSQQQHPTDASPPTCNKSAETEAGTVP